MLASCEMDKGSVTALISRQEEHVWNVVCIRETCEPELVFGAQQCLQKFIFCTQENMDTQGMIFVQLPGTEGQGLTRNFQVHLKTFLHVGIRSETTRHLHREDGHLEQDIRSFWRCWDHSDGDSPAQTECVTSSYS